MNSIFMNSENGRSSEYHILVLKLANKLDLRRVQKSVALSNRSIYYIWKNIKAHIRIINLKYLLQHGVMNLNYQMDHIQDQIFKIILSIFLRSIVKMLITRQSKYMQTKLKIGLHLKLEKDIILNF